MKLVHEHDPNRLNGPENSSLKKDQT